MINYSLLIGKIETIYRLKGKKSAFAKDLGISRTELRNKLIGKTNFSLIQAQRCKELLSLTPSEFESIFLN